MLKDYWKRLALCSRNYGLFDDLIYHKVADDILRWVVQSDKQCKVLRKCHSGIVGGHYARVVKTRKVWQSGLWWPTFMKDRVLQLNSCLTN